MIYLVTGTRPDIAYTTMFLSQFASQPNSNHMGAAKRVLRYLKGTRNLALTYHRQLKPKSQLIGYADSDLGNDKDDRKSISGFIFILNRNTISWRSKKRARKVATSTNEAELQALSYASKHMIWLQEGLLELKVTQQQPIMYGDNQGTLTLIRSQKINDLTKHVALTYHHVRNLVLEQECFDLSYVPSNENLADICTKSIARPQFNLLRRSIFQHEGYSTLS